MKGWSRVTRLDPCPVCGKPDWCVIGEKAINCMRIESAHPVKNGGWMHPFGADFVPPPPLPKPVVETQDFGATMTRWRIAQVGHSRLADIAETLCVSAQSLEWLGCVWSGERTAMAFPMHDATSPDESRPCGIRLRTVDGKKFAVTGSKAGIFFPYGAMLKLSSNRLYICEGPTDTATCLDMGCFAIGRASCRGGEDIVLSVIEQLNPFDCVVVCDNDGPGVEGATAIMERIGIPKTRFIPPGKDLRGFIRDGGNKATLDAILKNTLRQSGT